MEMTIKDILEINKGLNALLFTSRLKYRDARKLSDIKRIFEERLPVLLDMENGLIQSHSGIINENGSISFPDRRSAEEFHAAHEDFLDETDDVEVERLDVSAYVDGLEVEAGSLAALEKIFIFEKED